MNNQEIYATPDSKLTALDGSQEEEVYYATTNQRLLNYIIDITVGLFLFGMFIGFVAGVIVAATGNTTDSLQELIHPFLFQVSAFCAYYCIMESMTQCTLGKFITGTKVVNAKMEKPSFVQIIGRTLCRLIPFEAFSFLFGDQTSGWHDSLSKTYVIKTR